MADPGIRVKGYRELVRAANRADKDTKREVKKTFREVGKIVNEEWRDLLGKLNPQPTRTIEGLRTVARVRGIAVEERLGRTTGKREDWGKRVKGRGLEALRVKEDEVVREFEDAMDRVADHFERKTIA